MSGRSMPHCLASESLRWGDKVDRSLARSPAPGFVDKPHHAYLAALVVGNEVPVEDRWERWGFA